MSEVGYLQLLKENSKFRRFWSANIVSMLGEWFNTIALFTLILTYTGSEALLGLLFTIRMLGFALLQPIIGLLADRWSRKWIMVITNILQAGFQYGANSVIEKETGKNTFEHFQSAVDGQKKNKKFSEKFTNLVENKFEITRKKLKLN